MRNFKQRYGSWALVTGGTSGIGAALVQQLAQEGLNIVMVARNASQLDTQAEKLRQQTGVQVRTISADLTRPEGLERVLDATQDLAIDMLVPCAAIETIGLFVESTQDRHQEMVHMNVIAPMTLARHFGAGMAQRGRGAILFVSSLSGWMPQPFMAQYGATKSYVMGLAAGLHFEMKGLGVDVSVLSPGPTDTPMAAATGIDFASMGMSIMRPEDVAACGLAALGRKLDAVPGPRNKMMAFMMSRLMSRSLAGTMFKMMMGRALKR
ncbi:SDR family NAD(P)-dependent oxidoreductase [Limnohabitans planktonicus]|jgi:short-subunit dehydrogenase|uniref:SDR family oxidoreductase n=1 Tax=Limnohabitans planktonicus II-D5 TaxID=1293045 RepID=A0A2T7UFV0_9BURK|nr:SDR family NAD(P)-dependent oxidoreductase [Limnohabitans planktonicus]PVE43573.1 SDR family oxidoreductase [Limnohabitans planktonicus II-D5]|eukprot:gene26287-29693_t